MPTVLIVGAGSNVGESTAQKFLDAGYTVIYASRSGKLPSQFKHFPFDATKPATVPDLFAEARKAVGIPSVVIYNAAAANNPPAEAPLDTPINDMIDYMQVNTVSPWAVAGEAIKGFNELGAEGLGKEGATFIYTGNMLNDTVAPGFVPNGMGKSAAAHFIKNLALIAYQDKPYKFYFGDQRLADGTPLYKGLSGPAHADAYLELAQDSKQRAWQYTFVKDQGYVKFDKVDSWDPTTWTD